MTTSTWYSFFISNFLDASVTEVGIPTSLFCPKPITGLAREVREFVGPRRITPGFFFPPFTRPAVNPVVGTGLPEKTHRRASAGGPSA